MGYLGYMSQGSPEPLPPTADDLAAMMVPGADWDRDGFHPTMARPFPSMQCVGVVRSGPRSGQRCANRAVYGATVCLSHGAQLPVVRQKAERIVEAARLALVGSAGDAVDWIIDLGQNSTSDAVRLKAATEILDRSGVRGGYEVDVQVEQRQDPAEVLRERIQTLRKRTIEGELVERAALEATTEAEPDGTVLPDAPLTPNAEDPDADQQ